MNIKIVEKNGKKYMEGISGIKFIENEQDVLDIMAICGENEIDKLMLNSENLTEKFFDLKTQFAGNILQKFVNYKIKFALVLSSAIKMNDRFRELVRESNRGKHFGAFDNRTEAEKWLINL